MWLTHCYGRKLFTPRYVSPLYPSRPYPQTRMRTEVMESIRKMLREWR